MHGGEVDVRVFEREVCGDDDASSRDRSPVRLDAAWFAVLNVQRPRPLEHVAAVARYFLDQGEQIFSRVKLRLIVEFDSPLDGERQRRGFDVGGWQSEFSRRFHFGFDLIQVLFRLRVRVSRSAAEVTGDFIPLDERSYLLNGSGLRVGVLARPVLAEL
jgi:hypothetical protein